MFSNTKKKVKKLPPTPAPALAPAALTAALATPSKPAVMSSTQKAPLFTFKNSAEVITDLGDLIIELRPPVELTSGDTINDSSSVRSSSTTSTTTPRRNIYLVSAAVLCMASPLFRSIPTVYTQATKPNGHIGSKAPHPAIILNFDLLPNVFKSILEVLHHVTDPSKDLRDSDFATLVNAARAIEKCGLKAALKPVFWAAVEKWMDASHQLPEGWGEEARCYLGWVFGLPSMEEWRTGRLVRGAELDGEGGLWIRDGLGRERRKLLGYLPEKFKANLISNRAKFISQIRTAFETLYAEYTTSTTYSTCVGTDTSTTSETHYTTSPLNPVKQQCHLQQLGSMALHITQQALRSDEFWRKSPREILSILCEGAEKRTAGDRHWACYWKRKLEGRLEVVGMEDLGWGYEEFA